MGPSLGCRCGSIAGTGPAAALTVRGRGGSRSGLRMQQRGVFIGGMESGLQVPEWSTQVGAGPAAAADTPSEGSVVGIAAAGCPLAARGVTWSGLHV